MLRCSISVSDNGTQLSPLAQATQRIGAEPAISALYWIEQWESQRKASCKTLAFQSLNFWRRMETIFIEGVRWVWPSTCLASGWLHNAQISSVKANLVPMVRQCKVARHQFQGTSIRQVVLLDTMDQPRAELQPKWANKPAITDISKILKLHRVNKLAYYPRPLYRLILPKTPRYYFGFRFLDFDCMFFGLGGTKAKKSLQRIKQQG